MNDKILDTWSEDTLDSFLDSRYEYGLNHFRLSYIRTWQLYDYYNIRARSSSAIKSEMMRLASVKQKILELLNDYLFKIDFYKNSLHFESIKGTGITEWTPKNREMFIQKYFNLDDLFSIIDRPNNWFERILSEDKIVPSFFGIKEKLRLRPYKLLTLVWANAIKRNSKRDWINMALLFLWFFKNLNNQVLNRMVSPKEKKLISPIKLRNIWNNYKSKIYSQTADTLFRGLFLVQDARSLEGEVRELEASIDRSFFKNPSEYGKAWARFLCIASLFPERFRPIYEGLSTKNLDFDLGILSSTSSQWFKFPD
jgi:hypothetical protein